VTKKMKTILGDLDPETEFEWLGTKFRVSGAVKRQINHVPAVGPDNVCIHFIHDLTEVQVAVPKQWIKVPLHEVEKGEEFRMNGGTWTAHGSKDNWRIVSFLNLRHRIWPDEEVEVFR